MFALVILLTAAAAGPIVATTIYHFRKETGAGAIRTATQIGLVFQCLLVLGAVYFVKPSGCPGPRETGITCSDASDSLGTILFTLSVWVKKTGPITVPLMFVVYGLTYFYHEGTKDAPTKTG